MGNPSDERNRAKAVRIYQARKGGAKIGQIAKDFGIERERVHPLVKLGERIHSAKESTNGN